MKLLHNITFGFQTAELWRWLVVGAVCFSIVPGIIGARHIIDGIKPALRIVRSPGEVALVSGKLIKVRVKQDRDRLPCADARSDRMMLHFKNGADPQSDDFDAVMFVREGRAVPTRHGVHAFDLYLNLTEPLPEIPGGAWFYRANIYNGCAWLGRFFGGEAPIPAPTIPAKIVP